MSRLCFAVIAIALFGLTACSSDDECETSADCAGALVCREGACVPGSVVPDRPSFDGGVRPKRDAGFLDATTTTTTSSTADGGVGDGGLDDGGGASADAGADAGPTHSGFLRVGDYQSGAVVSGEAEARFDDNSGVTVEVQETSYGDCVLRERTTSSPPAGLEAQRILVSGFNNPRFTEIELAPTAPGDFEPTMSLGQNILAGGPAFLGFSIESTGATGTLDAFSVDVDTPPIQAVQVQSPTSGALVLAAAPITLNWTALPPAFQPVELLIELSGADRRVTLRCLVSDSLGFYTLPDAGRNAWRAASPQTPATMEVGYRVEEERIVPVLGGPAASVTFRVDNVIRYSVQL